MSHLILPNGLAPRKTEPLTELEMNWLAIGEDVCRKIGVTLACPHCLRNGVRTGAVLQGSNDTTDRTLSVTCQCTRWVFRG